MIEIADIKASILSQTLIQDKFFKNAEFLKDKRERLISYSGGYTVVVPAVVKGEKWAFRCWHTPIKDAKERYSLIGKSIKKSKLPYFCSFDYTEKGLIIKGESYPITKMRWVEGSNLKKYIVANSKEKSKIQLLARKFLEMLMDLHSHHFAHGDLQHGNIIVSDSGEIYLVDYDSMYVPEMKNQFPDIISGLIDYQHPSRKSNQSSSDRLDFFSEVIIYTSLLAIALNPDLVEKYNVEDSEALLFTSKDFENLKGSQVYKDLRELKDDEIDQCLDILQDYLSIKDLNDLNPIESYLMSVEIECPKIVPINENFTIKWVSKGAQRVELSEFGDVPLSGRKDIKLSSPKSLTFTLISETGFKVEKTLQIDVAPRAVIKSFKSDKEYTLATVPVKIVWNCTNAKKVEIEGFGEQKLSGSIIVTPDEETTYTLYVQDDFGIQRRDIVIKKLPLPMIKQILVPAPNINRNVGITYQAPKFNLTIPTPTFDTVLSRIEIPKTPKLSKSGYYVHSIAWGAKNKPRNFFKSLFSIFSRKNN